MPIHAFVAYGDSMSDLPLFAALDNTVAVHADPALEVAARITYRGNDLREVSMISPAKVTRSMIAAQSLGGSGARQLGMCVIELVARAGDELDLVGGDCSPDEEVGFRHQSAPDPQQNHR